jgi:general secretion pathway protein G
MAPKSRAGRFERGFTVAELLVVLLIIGLIAAVAVPNVSGAIRRAEEAALRENLQVMRRALDDYFVDKGAYPAELGALVDDRYIRFVPDDPVAGRDAGWALVTDDQGGILDVKSASNEVGSDDVPYDEW